MSEYLDRSNGENLSKDHYIFPKEILKEMSPRSPLNTHSPPLSTMSSDSDSLDLAIDGIVDNSIEQLYHYVCEMQSSDYSPSRRSFLSYGEESRIDSELRFLVGGDYCPFQIKVEVPTQENGGDISINPNDNTDEINSPSEPKKTTLRSKVFSRRPPNGRRNAKGSRKLVKGPSMDREPGYLAPYLLKQARDVMVSGDSNPGKALGLALRAMKLLEVCSDSNRNLDLVVCLHVVAAIYCRLGRYTEAIPVLERSIEIPVMDLGHDHALAKFAGCMQLGDTYAMLGRTDNSILLYTAGLEIQRQVLGENDIRLGHTCRYLAEARVQALQFDEAEKVCLMALEIHKENGLSGSIEEASDRRLLGLICDSKGDYEGALEHYVLASMALASNGLNADAADIDCSIGDAYLSLARYNEAVFAYQKALNILKASKGESHVSVASVLVRLADLYNKIGKFRESKAYSENALRIYAKRVPRSERDEIASGLVELSAIYESMNEPTRALQLLQMARDMYGNSLGQQSVIAAGIEAQIGVLYYILGSYSDSYNSLNNAVLKFRASGEKKSAPFGIALNQMGLVCVQLLLINEAADLFEEAKSILEVEFGQDHVHTLSVCTNLAGTYDAMGRSEDAIEILKFVVQIKEEKFGTANLDVVNEKHRLSELQKDARKVKNRKSKSLQTLLSQEFSQNYTS